jgi:hypothetical protein
MGTRLLCLWRRYPVGRVVIGVGDGGGSRLLILALRNRVDWRPVNIKEYRLADGELMNATCPYPDPHS